MKASIFERIDLDKVNSATKYPSILTYHELGKRGEHIDSLMGGQSFLNMDCEITEKVDGANTRIILYGDDYLIGSREDIIYAKGDRLIHPSAVALVNTVRGYADAISSIRNFTTDAITVIFGEVYGGKVTAKSKNYTTDTSLHDFRVFDVAEVKVSDIENKTVEQIASWRQHGGQEFIATGELSLELGNVRSNGIQLHKVPVIKEISGCEIPCLLDDTRRFLRAYAFTNVKLSVDAKGASEGIIIRSKDRSLIRKLRFENYNKIGV